MADIAFPPYQTTGTKRARDDSCSPQISHFTSTDTSSGYSSPTSPDTPPQAKRRRLDSDEDAVSTITAPSTPADSDSSSATSQTAVDEGLLRAWARKEMASYAAEAGLPNGAPVRAPGWYRPVSRFLSGRRPRAWIKDWVTGEIRPRTMLDEMVENMTAERRQRWVEDERRRYFQDDEGEGEEPEEEDDGGSCTCTGQDSESEEGDDEGSKATGCAGDIKDEAAKG
ncbi:hypothetical protein N656DRAFT_456151 [Canariomyces notabilis]|uniref:Uncharacterized protein n=1 Tax=Canariomyces notabilis TaxID=2074819 RepID=A0AAN6QGR5_9PEZI|nr:hypothetical protein N656DRAFT_456151 [Canariomyces arenarius]